MVSYTVPGMKKDNAEAVAALLQARLNALSDLALTLKHVHWNVVGPNFIAVHTMLDPQVDAVRGMVDETAEQDPVTQDMLIAHSAQLEQFHWFVRAHLENADGSLITGNAKTERTAAKRASSR